eukprot:Hpha_TRINITY_DN16241_c3_g1::TRINITY_DN16241_c3_g1_i1::g.12220::m.12220/K05016/CLCN7; chloride channel 7
MATRRAAGSVQEPDRDRAGSMQERANTESRLSNESFDKKEYERPRRLTAVTIEPPGAYDEEDSLLGDAAASPMSPLHPFWEPSAKYQYESLDFVEVENRLKFEDRRRSLATDETECSKGLGDWQRWVLLIVIGALTGLTAFGIAKGIDALTKKKWEWAGSRMGESGDSSVPFWPAYAIFTATNLVLCFIASLFVVIGEPLAAGSGIPEVKCYLNGVRIYRIVRFRTLVSKAVGILFSVASGLPCGKEGPMIHSGAVIGGGVATGKSSKLHFDTGFFRRFRGDREKRLFVAAGAAAGVAAAFGAPIGGVLFAVEEACSWWTLDMSMQIFFCATCSSVTLNLVEKWNDPQTPASGQTNFGQLTASYTLGELPLFVMLGVLGGLVGAAFNALNMKLTRIRKRVIRGIKWRRVAEALAVNLLVSTTLFTLTSRLYQCQPITQIQDDGAPDSEATLDYVKQYGCTNSSEYNDMATYFFSQTESSIKHLFHSGQPFAYSSLFAQYIPQFFLTVLTYGIAVPSGLFMPCLSLGAGLGRFFGQAVRDTMGTHALHLGCYSLFGAAAVLGGVIRMTVSLSVIVMEASGNATYIVPLMLITCTAKYVGDLFNHGIYDEHIMFNRVPLMEQELHDKRLRALTAHYVMNRTDFPILPPQPTAEELLVCLSTFEDHNGFIVTEDGTSDTRVQGLILRRALMILINKGAFGRRADSLTSEDFVKSAHEREFLKVEKYAVLSVPNECLHERMNLERYMEAFPFTVQEDTPLPRVYSTFRSLALRHLIVVDRQSRPRGIIARKNLVHLKERQAGEMRVDPTDGQLKLRSQFTDPHSWREAAAHIPAFDVERHPSRQRLQSMTKLTQGAEPRCLKCRGAGTVRNFFSHRECDVCGGKGYMPAGAYYSVGCPQVMGGEVFVDPQIDTDRDDLRMSLRARSTRLDFSTDGRITPMSSPTRVLSPGINTSSPKWPTDF